jgi:hypothetical protein
VTALGVLIALSVAELRRLLALKGAESRTWPVSCVFASVARYGDAPATLTGRPPWCYRNSPT